MSYKVLKSFKGSPDGSFVVDYAAGEIVELSPSLAAVAVKEKWVKEMAVKARVETVAQAEMLSEQGDQTGQVATAGDTLATQPE